MLVVSHIRVEPFSEKVGEERAAVGRQRNI